MRGKAEQFMFVDDVENTGTDMARIKKLLKSNRGRDFFLGVREDYLGIYYKGMSIAKVKPLKNGGCSYTLSYYYLKGVKDDKGKNKYDEKTFGYCTLSSDVFWKEKNKTLIK